ncbi:MAG TPA: alpha/beta hydrolase [Anaerolineaceae bacterium]|nr:alpha/beta hydrolase [Anaerolineaceae bacterium]
MSSQIQPPGQMVDIGGLRLHALLRGEGTPVVLLEPALGGFALQYAHIQAGVAAFTQVLAYDRAGQGWSDRSPRPRTSANLAAEWKALLDRLDLRPPYVLVGHSFGGLLARAYAGFYLEEAAGMVMVDATHVDEYAPFRDMDSFARRAAGGVRLLKLASRVGIGKVVARLSLGNMAKSLSKEDLDSFLAVASRIQHHETMLAEFSQHRCFYGPGSEVPSSLGDIPLVVVTAGSSVSGPGKIGGLTSEQMNALHLKLQADLVHLSSRGEQIVIPGASHLSILMQPEYAAQVVEAIRHVVEQVREG